MSDGLYRTMSKYLKIIQFEQSKQERHTTVLQSIIKKTKDSKASKKDTQVR
jgi:hypothetical protein